MTFGITANVLAKRMHVYYKISERVVPAQGALHVKGNLANSSSLKPAGQGRNRDQSVVARMRDLPLACNFFILQLTSTAQSGSAAGTANFEELHGENVPRPLEPRLTNADAQPASNLPGYIQPGTRCCFMHQCRPLAPSFSGCSWICLHGAGLLVANLRFM